MMDHISLKAPIPCHKGFDHGDPVESRRIISQGATVSLWSVAYGAMW